MSFTLLLGLTTAAIVAVAKKRLKDSPEVHTKTAIQQNTGLIELQGGVAGAAELEAAGALQALGLHQDGGAGELVQHGAADHWRAGDDTGQTPCGGGHVVRGGKLHRRSSAKRKAGRLGPNEPVTNLPAPGAERCDLPRGQTASREVRYEGEPTTRMRAIMPPSSCSRMWQW